MDANEGIEEYFIADEPPKTYEHFYLKIAKDSEEYQINQEDSLFWDYNKLDKNQKNFIKYMTYYQKALFNKALDRIHGLKGSNPYILTLDIIFNGTEYKSNINDTKEPKNREKYNFNRIEKHFNDAKNYVSDPEEKNHLEKLKICLMKNLERTIYTDQYFIDFMKNKLSDKEEISITIRVYIDFGNLDTVAVRNFNQKYLKDKVFLLSSKKYIYNGKCSLCHNDSELSQPSFLNTTGDDFGMKLTMPISLINFVCKECSVKLYKFKVMTDNNQLTNPFPLFIDKKNLFGEQKSILKDNKKKKSYREIIKSIYFTNPKDLKNFYLINYASIWNKGNKTFDLKIKDLDYVENFQYMTMLQIKNFLEIKNSFILNDFYDRELSVFQFEKIINELVFQKNLQRYYFSDYKDIKITYWKIDSSNSNSTLKNYLIKYRQNFYDYIYKSHQSALDLIDFKEMLLDIITDDIKHDEKDKNGYSIYENEIKEKLNLLFSLQKYKEQNLDSNELVKLKEKLREKLGYWEEYKDDENKIKNRFMGGIDHIEQDQENDKFFAFLIGQFARFLLSKSKSKKENLTHADFAGFLDWYESRLLKSYVLDIFNKYAHEFRYSRSNGKVENAISIIQTYKEDLVMDQVKEYMIAGYFADNYFYEEKDKLDEEESENE